ncbi:MAG: cysteine desulfurase [Actinobacteria bacterium]|nr:cysteine desulfurase [Actinomycetota bacterium]
MPQVYFDHASTTPISPVALESYIEQSRLVGNASSLHSYGRLARKRVEESRESLASLIDCHSSEIIFTSSGTEANNLAIKGIFWHRATEDPKRNLILISTFEHHAVLDPALWLGETGQAQIEMIKVSKDGYIDLEQMEEVVKARHEQIALISVMHSNNEVGTIQPIEKIAKLADAYQIPLHSDAVQSLGKVKLSFKGLGLFAMTVSAHKVGGPIGVAALVLRKGVDITPLIHGGGQERDIRSGTINPAGIASFISATASAMRDMESNYQKIFSLRQKLISTIQEQVSDVKLNSPLSGEILPGIANIEFPATESDSLLLLFDAEGIACSTGSACSAGVQEASHVLLAMGRSEVQARGSLRFSLGIGNSESEIEYLEVCIKRVVDRARAAYRG